MLGRCQHPEGNCIQVTDDRSGAEATPTESTSCDGGLCEPGGTIEQPLTIPGERGR